jgi:SAM-dependent methyltransferase
MDMNSPLGKEILALVRKADYAHAGEEEAIEIVFKDMPKDPKRLLLDVGCGRGGTAEYVQRKGWGAVVGVDIDSDSIEYARRKYPGVEFMAADAMNLAQGLPRRFDIIYLFNTFYALSDHLRALRQLRALSHEPGEVFIFDYLLRSKDRQEFPFKEWNPLDFSIIQKLFPAAGWRVTRTDEISALYAKWYKELVLRIDAASDAIIALGGREWLDFVRTFYGKIVDAIERNLLGGAIVCAVSDHLP